MDCNPNVPNILDSSSLVHFFLYLNVIINVTLWSELIRCDNIKLCLWLFDTLNDFYNTYKYRIKTLSWKLSECNLECSILCWYDANTFQTFSHLHNMDTWWNNQIYWQLIDDSSRCTNSPNKYLLVFLYISTYIVAKKLGIGMLIYFWYNLFTFYYDLVSIYLIISNNTQRGAYYQNHANLISIIIYSWPILTEMILTCK